MYVRISAGLKKYKDVLHIITENLVIADNWEELTTEREQCGTTSHETTRI